MSTTSRTYVAFLGAALQCLGVGCTETHEPVDAAEVESELCRSIGSHTLASVDPSVTLRYPSLSAARSGSGLFLTAARSDGDSNDIVLWRLSPDGTSDGDPGRVLFPGVSARIAAIEEGFAMGVRRSPRSCLVALVDSDGNATTEAALDDLECGWPALGGSRDEIFVVGSNRIGAFLGPAPDLEVSSVVSMADAPASAVLATRGRYFVGAIASGGRSARLWSIDSPGDAEVALESDLSPNVVLGVAPAGSDSLISLTQDGVGGPIKLHWIAERRTDVVTLGNGRAGTLDSAVDLDVALAAGLVTWTDLERAQARVSLVVWSNGRSDVFDVAVWDQEGGGYPLAAIAASGGGRFTVAWQQVDALLVSTYDCSGSS